MANSVHIVTLLYYPELAQDTVACATQLARKLALRGHAGSLLTVVNNPKIDRARLRCETVAHDNTGLEFGGYQRGLDMLGTLSATESVVFLNDTCMSHHVFGVVPRANLLAAASDMTGRMQPAAAGVVTDSQVGSFSIRGLALDRWVSTWAFVLNHAALQGLQWRIYEPELEQLVTGAPTLDAFWDTGLDPRLVGHLNVWLFGSADQHRWYGAQPLSAANAPGFARKARAILQEKYLSARLLQQRARLYSIRPAGIGQRLLHRLQCAREGRPRGFV